VAFAVSAKELGIFYFDIKNGSGICCSLMEIYGTAILGLNVKNNGCPTLFVFGKAVLWVLFSCCFLFLLVYVLKVI
jgi:hypothetical protein